MLSQRCSRLSPSLFSTQAVLLVAAIAALFGAREVQAQGVVDLRLVGPSTPIIPGQTFDVKLRAQPHTAGTACSFVAIDCIVGWDPTKLQYIGITGTGSIPLSSSYLPTPANDYTGINEVNPPADGSLLYYALTPLGTPQAVPDAGVQVVTFRFKSISLDLSHTVSVIDNLTVTYPTETIVYDGTVPGVDDFGVGIAATITQLDCSTIYWYRDSDGDGAGDPADSTTSCTQPAGYVGSSTDLCPTNASLIAPVTYYADADADGFGDLASPSGFCQTSAPSGYASNSSDCDDTATMYADGDGDGFGAGAKIACGGVSTDTDCNNANNLIHPGAVENCANLGTDNDCDSVNTAAEAIDSVAYYVDGDSDGFGAGAATMSCSAISGSVTNASDCNDALVSYVDGDGDGFGSSVLSACSVVTDHTDCNDASAVVYPGALENCANLGTDNDCDSVNSDAEAVDSLSYYTDGDGDNYGSVLATAVKSCSAIGGSVTDHTDCDDTRAFVNPGAPEVCDADNRDEDCDTVADNADNSAADAGKTDFYADGDADTYGAGSAVRFCDLPASGYSAVSTDCDDTRAFVNPGAPEVCDADDRDEDCDTVADNADNSAADAGKTDFYTDSDNDNYGTGSAARFCDEPALYALVAGDCDDTRAFVNPGAPEVCDADDRDEDCDMVADNADSSAADAGKTDFYTDSDNDNYGTGSAARFCDEPALYALAAGDCDDTRAFVNPGAPEVCDADDRDEDCDTFADNADNSAADAGKTDFYADSDNDNYGTGSAARFCDEPALYALAAGDCDDTRAAVYPGALENCGNLGTDNDCDGTNDAAEAIDSVAYYVDGDADGFGAGTATMSCAAIPGSVTDSSDCNDAATMYTDADGDGFGAGAKVACNGVSTDTDCDDLHDDVYPGAPELCANLAVDNDCDLSTAESEATDRLTWYEDADHDTVGDASVSVLACSQPADYVASSGDTCPADPLKLAPLGCGCGNPDTDADSDGNPDCFGQIAALSLVADQSLYAAGEQVVVRVNAGASGTGLRSASLSIRFDATQLELASAAPVAGSAYSSETSEVIDNIAGSLRYVVAVPGSDPASSAAAALADLVFNVRAGASFCSTGGLVSFGSVGGVASSFATTTTVPMVPTSSSLGAISLLSTPPSFAGVPADASMAADAGTIAGAAVPESAVTASDTCGGAAIVDLLVTYPDASTSTSWPVGGMFPVGTSVLEWTATDAVGQTSTVSRSVIVANHQLLDVAVSMFGSITQNSTRSIRVTAGGTAQVFEMPLNAGSGAISGMQVPVAPGYSCILVKDIEHSLSKSASASVAGVRYSASAQLRQGDSNNDDIVDVLDFGIFVGDRGLDPTRRGISNFNSDLTVNNFDFAFLTLSFFNVGDSCSGFDGPGQPIGRISVKELRRRGMGELAEADINHDGWLDMRDVQAFANGMQPAPAPAGPRR